MQEVVEEDENAPKTEAFYPESAILIKKMMKKFLHLFFALTIMASCASAVGDDDFDEDEEEIEDDEEGIKIDL